MGVLSLFRYVKYQNTIGQDNNAINAGIHLEWGIGVFI